MKYVLDTSVALKWCFPEANVDRALQLRDEFRNGVHELLAPSIFPAEVAHAISKAHRQNRISADEANQYFDEILLNGPRLYPYVGHLLGRAYELSLQNRKGVYDCLYVALAEEENCSVVTADEGMINPRSKSNLVILLKDLP